METGPPLAEEQDGDVDNKMAILQGTKVDSLVPEDSECHASEWHSQIVYTVCSPCINKGVHVFIDGCLL